MKFIARASRLTVVACLASNFNQLVVLLSLKDIGPGVSLKHTVFTFEVLRGPPLQVELDFTFLLIGSLGFGLDCILQNA